MTNREGVGASVEAAENARRVIRRLGRYAIVSDTFPMFPDIVAADPLRIAIDTRSGGISGHEARRLLSRDHQIMVEVATDSAIVAVVGNRRRARHGPLHRSPPLPSLPLVGSGEGDRSRLRLPSPE